MNAIRCVRGSRGLTIPVILVSGVIAAVFICIAIFSARYMIRAWSPTAKNIDRLLTKRRYGEALSLVESRQGRVRLDSTQASVMAGKIWLAIAWEKMNRDRWRSYGKNVNDWFDIPEVSKAESFLIQAVERDRDNFDAHYYLGILYMEKGWYPSAEMELLTALKVSPGDIRAKQNLGVLYSKMNRLEPAKSVLLDANRLDPDNASIMKNLAILYRFHLDMPESAMVWANRYLNSEPQGDRDMNVMREEFNNMAERYPELIPEEPLRWRMPSKYQSPVNRYQR